LVEKIPHRPYWDGFLFNDLKNFPEGEEEQVTSTNIDSPGPTFCRNYFGIFKDNFIEKDGKKYFEFNPKEVLER